jgi:flagellar biosynthesis GTPase FlhF
VGVVADVELCRSASSARRVSFASTPIQAVPALRAYRPEGRAMNKNKNITVVVLLVLAAACTSRPRDEAYVPPMDPTRKVSELDCSRAIDPDGNLMCREVTEAERRAKIAEEERQARLRREAEERQARARKEAEERAERERLERERAEQLAREEAARKQRAAEEERLAAERRRLEAEAARKAQEERERQEKAEAEARARQLAEQQAREAAERECRRLEQERLDGRAVLESFVADYGKVDEFKGIAGQITAFLKKPRKAKPCPPA